MEHLHNIFEKFGKIRVSIERSEKSTGCDEDDEPKHSAAKDGMEVVDELFLLRLDEAVGDQVPEDEEIGDEEDDEAIDHVEEGGYAVVFEDTEYDVDVEKYDPRHCLSNLMREYLAIGGAG